MSRSVLLFVLCAVAAITVSGCAGPTYYGPHGQRYDAGEALTDTAVGAGLGAVIGAIAGDAGTGAAIGAVTGFGYNYLKQDARNESYRPRQRVRLICHHHHRHYQDCYYYYYE